MVFVDDAPVWLTYRQYSVLILLILGWHETRTGFVLDPDRVTAKIIYLLRKAIDKACGAGRGRAFIETGSSEEYRLAPSAARNLALDEALKKLETLDPRQSKVVELRFFGGLSLEETAEALRVSVGTVRRVWSLAQAWLFRELSGKAE